MTSAEFIFVYGTLRKNVLPAKHELLTRYCNYFSNGYLQGILYEISGYPGAIESGNPADKVVGEIYTVNNKSVLSLLDEYEQCSSQFPAPHEYVRKKLPIFLATGNFISAWVYVYNHGTSHLTRITSGDYTLFLKK